MDIAIASSVAWAELIAPKLVLAVAALETSLRLLVFSILSVFKLEKLESTSVLVRGDPLLALFTIVDILRSR